MNGIHNVKINKLGDSKTAVQIFVDGKEVGDRTLEASLNIKGGEIPELILKQHAGIDSIELNAKVREKQIENVVIVKFETSEGLETLTFKNGENIIFGVDDVDGTFWAEERQGQGKLNKKLVLISLESFVIAARKEIKEGDK